jgi:hypothetical protein
LDARIDADAVQPPLDARIHHVWMRASTRMRVSKVGARIHPDANREFPNAMKCL